ncbi:MAG: hypothetical protein ACW99Q_08865, partial [Candidatus Kariarchaeaceae archaeon]
IIWNEGSIFVIGFEQGLQSWYHFLKPQGFMVVHDRKKHVSHNFKMITDCGYKLLSHFSLSFDVWWTEYYKPLMETIDKLTGQYQKDLGLLHILEREYEKIKIVKKRPNEAESIYYIIQKD